MSSAVQREQDREKLAAPNAQDAGEGVGHEGNAQQEYAYDQSHSAFEDDSDEDPERMSDDDTPLPTADNAVNQDAMKESQDDEDDENEDNSWLGATKEEIDVTEEDVSAGDHSTATKRPHDLILDHPRKRSPEDLESESEPEDVIEPKISPRTRKRLRLESEQGFPYDRRPKTMFYGWQADDYDEVGGVAFKLPSNNDETERSYRGGRLERTPDHLKNQRMGKAMPPYPDLPRRISPLGQNAHKGGNWKGIAAIPLPREEEYIAASRVEKGGPQYSDGYDQGYEADDQQGPRPETPAPDYDDHEDPIDEQKRDDTNAGEDRKDSSHAQTNRDDTPQQSDEITATLPRPPFPSFDQVLAIKPITKWDEEDEEDDAAFFKALTDVSSAQTSDSMIDETISETTTTESPAIEHQESEQIDRDQPTDSIDDVASHFSSSSSDKDEPSPSNRPTFLERHPSSKESGREVGRFSKPLPRDDELARLKLQNAKLALEIIKEQKSCEDRRRVAKKDHNQLITAYNDLQASQRAFGEVYQRLRDDYYELQYTNEGLKGEILAMKQQAEAHEEQLVADRAKENIERLAYINTLKADAKRMKTWAEKLDNDAEPMRLANDNLTATLEASETANEVLKKEVEDVNATLVEAKIQIKEVAAEGIRVTRLYKDCLATATTTPQPQSPSTPPPPPSLQTTLPQPTPSFPLPPFNETRSARETRWRNLGANKANRDAHRKARDEADALFAADRELRLEAYTAATGRVYVEGEATVRRKELMRIVDEFRGGSRRGGRSL